MRNKIEKLYMCGVDWQHELGECGGGVSVYSSIKDIKKCRECVAQCGIVEVEVSLVGWAQEQNFYIEEKRKPFYELARKIRKMFSCAPSGSLCYEYIELVNLLEESFKDIRKKQLEKK